MSNSTDSKSIIFQEKSIFHTTEPRDTKMRVHLFLILLCFASSLLVAIIFAETGSMNPSLAAKKLLLDETEQTIDQGRSE